MLALTWLIPALPFAGFAILALAGGRLSRRAVALVGVGSVGLSALLALLVGGAFLASPSWTLTPAPARSAGGVPPGPVGPAGGAYDQTLWTWMAAGDLAPAVGLRLDALSLIMVLVVTVVGFLIHLYSTEFMSGEEGYARFFAAMNLFVGSMLVLVLAADLLLLYLGWEGVGLCSYLLIGFWYRDPANGRAARKAFIVTRVGDTALAIGLFLLFTQLGTLEIQELMARAAGQWPAGSALAVAAAALLLGGAVGKSAQLPLQVWLPDAMAGPSPVSALIHAATMVTAGVYLIARTHVLFSLAPAVMLAVAVIGAVTLLLAGISALTQWDIKRVLAYSTISQIGYMFLALGVGAWSAAIFHFMTHAFFKALLFLAAGSVILSLHHEHNMAKMRGLRRLLPTAFWTFLAGAASLAALPLVTAGFYSKDLILFQAWSAVQGSPWLWAAGLAGALITAVYAFRLVFLTFFGEPSEHVRASAPLAEPGPAMRLPLIVLAVLSIVGGLVELPRTLGGLTLFTDLLHTALPAPQVREVGPATELWLQIAAAVAVLAGVLVAYVLFYRRPESVRGRRNNRLGDGLHRLTFSGWGFDWLYERLFVRPYNWLARANEGDVVDLFFTGLARLSLTLHHLLSRTQNGRVRWYAWGLAAGAAILLTVVLLWS
jgi:NADH-quinone oxidoreductase subunit L